MKRIILFFAVALMSLNTFSQQLTILGTENQGDHFKFIIAADGFTSSQMSTFYTKATAIKNAMMNLEPYKSNASKINWYRDYTVSTQSGYSVLGGTTKNTFFDLYTNNQGMAHYYGFSSSTRTLIENRYGDLSGGNRVFLIIVSNNPNYAGYGDIASYPTWGTNDVKVCVVSVDATYMTFLAMHETGHSFGDLDDEYVDATYAASTEGSAYISNHSNRLNIKDSNPGGWLEGGRYVATGKWRYGNGLMRSATWSFHSRNEDLIQDRIDDEAISTIKKAFSLSTGTHISNVCDASYSQTKHHDGSGTYPVINDYIYVDKYGSDTYSGANKWFKISEGSGWYIKIDYNGKVTAKLECEDF